MMISVVVRQTTVTVTDDLDGSGNAKEVTFGWDGSWWTIDLNAKNRAGLEKALKALLGQGHETARAERPQRRSPCRLVGRAASRNFAWGHGGGARLGQEQRSPGQRSRPGQCSGAAGLRRRTQTSDRVTASALDRAPDLIRGVIHHT
jgi:hypothetical protein